MSSAAERTPLPLRNLVDGELVDALDGARADVVDPATGAVVAQVPDGGAADVDRAVAAAERARRAWGRTTPRERSERLHLLADAIEDNVGELAHLESLHAGKPMRNTPGEVGVAIDNLRFLAGAARCLEGLAAGEYLPGYTSMIRREPIGVVGQIAAWNFPLIEAVWKLGPALAAGNTVVLKPATQTPLTALRFAELVADLLPPGVLNVITGGGSTLGAAIVGHPGVRMVSITGSVETGRAIAGAAAHTLARTHLELGGKAPVLVFDDADPVAAAAGIRGAGYFNSGQDCTAACRVLAGPKIYERLLEELVPAVASLRVGDPRDQETEMGPVISRRHQQDVHGFVERAVAAGARVETGGGCGDGPGFFLEPTIVTGAGQRDEIVQEEIFGPVVTVQRFADEDEALRLANDSRFGLAASVWTRDLDRALRTSRELEFGTVWINNHLTFISEMPHGGFKESGYGKEMSQYALHDYSQIKHVMARLD